MLQIRKRKAAIPSLNCRHSGKGWAGRCSDAFDEGPIMAMLDFAVLAGKVLFVIWAAQLIWIGSRLLERPVKRVLRSVLTSKDAPMKKAVQALRSNF